MDSAAALRRLQASLHRAGLEVPPGVPIRTMVRTYGAALVSSSGSPISELQAMEKMLSEREGLDEGQRQGILRHYKRSHPGSSQRNIYPNIIA